MWGLSKQPLGTAGPVGPAAASGDWYATIVERVDSAGRTVLSSGAELSCREFRADNKRRGVAPRKGSLAEKGAAGPGVDEFTRSDVYGS